MSNFDSVGERAEINTEWRVSLKLPSTLFDGSLYCYATEILLCASKAEWQDMPMARIFFTLARSFSCSTATAIQAFELKFDVTISSNCFRSKTRARQESEQETSENVPPALDTLNPSLQVTTASENDCEIHVRESWSVTQRISIMDAASIWKRLKPTWIFAVIVIQFVDLSVNRKYQFPSFVFEN